MKLLMVLRTMDVDVWTCRCKLR